MQETLQDNPVFTAFSNDEALFAEAAEGGWILAFPTRQCIPKEEQKKLLKRGPSNKKPSLQAHLLKPIQEPSPEFLQQHQRRLHSMQVFQALSGDSVVLYTGTGQSSSTSSTPSADARMIVNVTATAEKDLQQAAREPNLAIPSYSARVLFDEFAYNEELQSVKCLCIDSLLRGEVSLEYASATSLREQFSFPVTRRPVSEHREFLDTVLGPDFVHQTLLNSPNLGFFLRAFGLKATSSKRLPRGDKRIEPLLQALVTSFDGAFTGTKEVCVFVCFSPASHRKP